MVCSRLGSSLASRTISPGAYSPLAPHDFSLVDDGSWYQRNEFGLRLAIFFSAATASGAFGGLLAVGIYHYSPHVPSIVYLLPMRCVRKAAISNMDGVGGKPAWAWIFILEGLVTVVASFLSFWIIVDFPENATFLTEAERTVVIRRLQGDDLFSAAGERLQWKNIAASLKDWKTYLYSTSPWMGCTWD